jgi:hypothetical protein
LFPKYVDSGYVVFLALSEIGSHPGLFQVLVFHQDPVSRAIDVDPSGQHGERAAWLNGAFDFFGRSCDLIGKWFGWKDWLAETVAPIVVDASPLMEEAASRWRARWLPGRPTPTGA